MLQVDGKEFSIHRADEALYRGIPEYFYTYPVSMSIMCC
jgi:hypothetical protein